jgi:diguanylate cyclase (GGDEF)-like protein
MSIDVCHFGPTPDQLMAIIRTQTEIARLGLDLHGVMNLVVGETQALTGAAGAVVKLAEGEEMVYRAVSGLASSQLGLRIQRQGSMSGLCVDSNESLRCDDSETDTRVNREACRRVGLRSMIAVPLIHEGQAVGVLKVVGVELNAFDEGDLKVLGLMSNLIASSMFHAVKFGADELFRLATRDSLTGLANRSFFYDRLRFNMANARREARRMGVLLLDMDGLKPINDEFGHRAGDAAIRELGKRLSQATRESDTVARLGGDEFGIVLSCIDDRDRALAAARRLVEKCNGEMDFEGNQLRIGVSAGAAVYPDDGEHPEPLVEYADQGMYRSKRERKVDRDSRASIGYPAARTMTLR